MGNIEQFTKDGNDIYPVTTPDAVRDENGTNLRQRLGEIGNLSSLQTTAKDNLVNAINEVNASKQDTLVAGSGISIDGNVISAQGGGGASEYIFWGDVPMSASETKYFFMKTSEASEVLLIIQRPSKTASGVSWVGIGDLQLNTVGGAMYFSTSSDRVMARIVIPDDSGLSISSVSDGANQNKRELFLYDNRAKFGDYNYYAMASGSAPVGDEIIHVYYKKR